MARLHDVPPRVAFERGDRHTRSAGRGFTLLIERRGFGRERRILVLVALAECAFPVRPRPPMVGHEMGRLREPVCVVGNAVDGDLCAPCCLFAERYCVSGGICRQRQRRVIRFLFELDKVHRAGGGGAQFAEFLA